MPDPITRDQMIRTVAATAPAGVVTDMDGTISHFATRPFDAFITPRSLALLEALRDRLALVAVVSGRGAADLQSHVNLPGVICVGNHGLERWAGDRAVILPQAAAYRPALEAALAEIHTILVPGMRPEDKGATASVHYRETADPAAVYASHAPRIEAICRAHGLDYFEGRLIFELRPPIPVDKGTAFASLTREYGLRSAVFLGDDVTDAHGLRMARRLRETGKCLSFGVGVDQPETPDAVREAADVLVPGVEGVEDFLADLLAALDAGAGP